MSNQYSKKILALVRLAPNGARALAISAGIDAQKFHRVFSDRANVPNDMLAKLGEAVGFDEQGFYGQTVRSAICKQVADLDSLSELGFSWMPVCEVASERTINGGAALQRYFIAKLAYGSTYRVLLVRMAAIKFKDLFSRYEENQVPTIKVPTKEITYLNDVSVDYNEPTKLQSLNEALEAALRGDLQLIIDELQVWLAAGSGRSPREIAQRRETAVSRVAAEGARFHEWDTPTREMSKTHHLYPLSSQIKAVDAIGVIKGDIPVFVDVHTLKHANPRPLGAKAKRVCQHILVFHQTGTDTDPKFELLFDGPMKLILDSIKESESAPDWNLKAYTDSLKHRGAGQDYLTVHVAKEARSRQEADNKLKQLQLMRRESLPEDQSTD